MSWAWLAPLVLGVIASGLLARARRAVESERLKVALLRLRLVELRLEAARRERPAQD